MEHPVELKDGVTIGDKVYTVAVIAPLSAGDLIAACEAAETLQLTPAGPVMVQSPTRVARERVSRQVKRLETAAGEAHPGPLGPPLLKAMTAGDYDRLIQTIDRLDLAQAGAAEKAAALGRDGGAGGSG